MKKCPQCGTQYSDVTLSFCLQDGTPLIVAPQDTPTVVLGETETVVPRRDAFRVPLADDASQWGHSQSTRVASHVAPPEKKGSNTAVAVVLTIVGMLVLFGLVGLGAILFLRNSAVTPNTRSNNAIIAMNTSTPYSSPMPTTQTTPFNTPRPSPASTVAPPPPPTALASYPSTKRLVFARGAYSTSFSGDINPGDTRSLVLGCRSGQSLSANISGSSCVNIRGGGSSFRTTTNGGDNYVTISSTCSSVAHFTITISVI